MGAPSHGNTRGAGTRARILEAAQAAVLAKGFEATSIEEIAAEVEISRAGFFYHFADKNALARALLADYIDEEDRIFDRLFARARELHDDPLHAFLIGLKLLAEIFENLPGCHPGCLVATATYHERLFDAEVRALNRRALLGWRARFRTILEEIAARHPPRAEVDLEALADMVTSVCEGGIILSKGLNDPGALVRQVLLFRTLVQELFAPAGR
jgi:TetR/AcrR family transcriptional repressor of nem operon